MQNNSVNDSVVDTFIFRRATSNPGRLYSDIQLTGGGNMAFKETVNGKYVMRNFLNKRLKMTLLPIEDTVYNTFPAITFSCRLLTPRRQLGYDMERIIPRNIDPKNILPRIAKDEYVYASDNHVSYSIQNDSPPQ